MKKKRSQRLQTKLLLLFGCLFTITIWLVAFVIFKESEKTLTKKIGETRLETLHQISERSTQINNSSLTLTNLYSYDSTVIDGLTADLSSTDDQTLSMKITQNKEKYDVAFKDINLVYDVTIIGKNDYFYSSRRRTSDDINQLSRQLWLKKIRKPNLIYYNSFNDRFSQEQAKYVYSTSKLVTDSQNNVVGLVIITIDESLLANIFNNTMATDDLIYIVDNTGQVVTHPEKNYLGKKYIGLDNFKKLYGYNHFNLITKNNETYLLSSYYDSLTQWLIIEEMPVRLIYDDLNQTKLFIISIAFLANLLILLVTLYFSRKIARPIASLSQVVDQVKTGNLSIQSDITGYQEIELLGNNFNQMIQDISSLMLTNQEKEEQKRLSELTFLRSQINPHFIHNTLFSIKCLIDLDKKDEAINMLEAFTDLTKETFSVSQEFITLAKECNSVNKYLRLQQIRYGDKFLFEIDLADDTHELLVPALLLQPIVENAIFHGIEPKNDPGIVIITSFIKDQQLWIQISDDGVGIPPEKCDEIIKNNNLLTSSIGLFNVQKRIQLLFGEAYGVSLTSEQHIGTVVTLTLPLLKN